jgi:glutamine synthetase
LRRRRGVAGGPRAEVARAIEAQGIDLVRIGWCDLHGVLRGKSLVAGAVDDALRSGVGMVSTILLKDTSDRTAYRVFEPGVADALPGFRFANNLLLLPDPASFRVLPWAPSTGWLQAQAWFEDGTPVLLDTRRVLQQALRRLEHAGFGLACGLEVEFHIYRLRTEGDPSLDPQRAAWPGEPPSMSMIHPGYNLLAEGWADMADEPLRIVQRTAQGLGLPLRSLEIELGPSQVEAVFAPTDALTAADQMVLFRNGVRQALRRAGYHASFVCRPPFPNVMASGWHPAPVAGRARDRSQRVLPRRAGAGHDSGRGPPHVVRHRGRLPGRPARARSRDGGVLHADDQRLRPLPPERDGAAGGDLGPRQPRRDAARARRGGAIRRPGSRTGSASRPPNPYLYVAAQIHAGLDGIERGLTPGPATTAPYAGDGALLPTGLGEGLDALAATAEPGARRSAPTLVDWFVRVKRAELLRHDQADDKDDWQAREYFQPLLILPMAVTVHLIETDGRRTP